VIFKKPVHLNYKKQKSACHFIFFRDLTVKNLNGKAVKKINNFIFKFGYAKGNK